MSVVVLKLINAPINDLSGFASKLGFTFLCIIVLFLCIFPAECQISMSFVYMHIYIHMWIIC